MSRRILLFVLMALAVASCDDGPSQMTVGGIGSIERSDASVAIRFYDYTLLVDGVDAADTARVKFKVALRERLVDTASVYRAEVLELSDDLRSVIDADTAPAGMVETPVVPFDLHITRDFRRLDYFNITTMYETADNNDDIVRLTYAAEEEQEGPADSLVVLWLRHYQRQADAPTRVEYNTISVPLNQLQPADSTMRERLSLKVKRLGFESDTVVTDYVYSFKNIME